MGDYMSEKKRLREARGGNPWRASQVARFDRGDTSAITYATREQLAREPPSDSARRLIPPEGPPPEAPQGPPPGTSEPGSWRWVWVPDRPDVRDRDQPSSRAERESVAGSESIASRAEREATVVSTVWSVPTYLLISNL